MRSDPRVVSAAGIVERADTLLIPAAHFDLTITAQGQTESGQVHARGSCAGIRCILSAEGERLTVTLDDLLAPGGADQDFTRIDLGRRGGFNTAFVEGQDRLSEHMVGGLITARPTTRAHAFWGEWGYAGTATLLGPFSGRSQGTSFRGRLDGTLSFAVGDVTGFNPRGVGSATWTGVSEAVSTRTYERRAGTATVHIPDLSTPRVNVYVDVAGYAIGTSAWDGIPIYRGRYAAGISGRDRLVGNFHGPNHEETYGVFDTGAYVGAFGASR